MKILLMNGSHCDCSVRPILTTDFKKEKVSFEFKGLIICITGRTTEIAFLSFLYFVLDCTDCFYENDTLPGKVT